MLKVDEMAIQRAVMDLLARSNLLMEGSDAVTLAALAEYSSHFRDRCVTWVVTGGHINLPLRKTGLCDDHAG